MQWVEIGFALLTSALIISLWSKRFALSELTQQVRLAMVLLVVIFVGLRLFVVGYSWQFFPLMAVSAVILISSLVLPAKRLILKRVAAGFMAVLALLAIAPLVLFPIPKLPEPSGQYSVGTANIHLIDESREEVYGRNAGDVREFMVQLWYPTDSQEGYPKAEYLSNARESASAIAVRLGLPSFILQHTEIIQVNSVSEPPLASNQKQFPLLVFSHGYQSIRGQATPLMEELASHGYIVASMEHTFGAAVTIFPDGRVEFQDPDTLTGEGAAYDASARRLGQQWQGDIEFF